jgi:hypothetical protein
VLPTFIVIGAMKAGTTSLWSYLDAHPDVFMCYPKEPDYFGVNRNTHRGREWYEGLFADSTRFVARGEASTSYSKSPLVARVPEAIASAVPDIRLVYLIRNPLERIRSQFAHEVDRNHHRRSVRLADAIKERPDYLDNSRYGMQLRRYLEHFDRSSILVLSADTMRRERQAALADVLAFIGVETGFPIESALERELNLGADKRQSSASADGIRAALRTAGLMDKVPRGMKLAVRRRWFPAIPPERLAIDDETERLVWARLESDLADLRQMVGPEMDLWGRA